MNVELKELIFTCTFKLNFIYISLLDTVNTACSITMSPTRLMSNQ